VPSTEVPSIERVDPGNPDDSYIVLKLENAPGIVGVQMPFGGPYLPQSTIDVIRQWITNGAPPASGASAAAAFALAATAPPDHAHVQGTPQILVAFTHELDFSLLNETTVVLERLDAEAAVALPAHLALARGNPAAVLLVPANPLVPGSYRVRLRGTGAAALADVGGQVLGTDAAFEFTVDDSP
jgi:hypothetical protein